MTPIDTTIITELNHAFELQLPDKIAFEEARSLLSVHINHLIKNNFETLVALLYKIDINEDKLKFHLIDNPNEDAGNIIAALIIERLVQKTTFRKQFKSKPSANDNEEKW